jgi:putative CocE/NonD family hydrolase
MRRRAIAGLAGLGLAGLVYARRRELLARALGLRPAEHPVAVERDLAAAMPDGATLYADRYYPRAPGRYPTILVRTPYGRPSETQLLGPVGALSYLLFAERGYNVVVQSVRGRFRSEGHFEPFVHEAADGRASLAWIAEQPWFDGSLGMWGPSYLGYAQWAVAAEAPPYLKALVPIVTTARFSKSFYPESAFAFESSLRWANLISATHRPGGNLDMAGAWQLVSPRRQSALAQSMAGAVLSAADSAAIGAPVPFYQQWLADPDPEGQYWRRVDHHRAVGTVELPVHLVAGWYDIFLHQQLSDYASMLGAGRTPYLTVLPRHHNDPALLLDGVREGLWWLDAHLKGRRELLQRRPVRLALMGSPEWHEMDYWPPPAAITRYYLHEAGRLATDAPAPESQPDSYLFDPRDPTPSFGGPVLSTQGGPRDQRPIEGRGDLICFTTAPLREAVDVIGPVRLELFVASSVAHTDFVGRLCDVAPDGRSTNICDGIFRVAPGKGEPQADGSLRIEIDMWSTAQRFAPGHRIRLHVCSAAHPRWSLNYGDGRPLHVAGDGPGAPAQQRIFHDSAHPSALVLPIVSAATRAAMAAEGE